MSVFRTRLHPEAFYSYGVAFANLSVISGATFGGLWYLLMDVPKVDAFFLGIFFGISTGLVSSFVMRRQTIKVKFSDKDKFTSDLFSSLHAINYSSNVFQHQRDRLQPGRHDWYHGTILLQ
jgi:hypothetical protein